MTKERREHVNITLDYLELLRTGRLGPVFVGASHRSVETMPGCVNEGAVTKTRTIYSLGSRHVQITCDEHKVVHFGVYFHYEHTDRTLSLNTNRVEFIAVLDRIGIEWELEMSGDTEWCTVSSGTVAIFTNGTLDSVQSRSQKDPRT